MLGHSPLSDLQFLDKQWLWADCLRPLRTWPAPGRSPLPDLVLDKTRLQVRIRNERWLWAVCFVPHFQRTCGGFMPTASFLRTCVGFEPFACLTFEFSGQALKRWLRVDRLHRTWRLRVASARLWFFRMCVGFGHSLRSFFSDQETSERDYRLCREIVKANSHSGGTTACVPMPGRAGLLPSVDWRVVWRKLLNR